MNFLKLPIEDPYLEGKQLSGMDGNYDFMPIPFRRVYIFLHEVIPRTIFPYQILING